MAGALEVLPDHLRRCLLRPPPPRLAARPPLTREGRGRRRHPRRGITGGGAAAGRGAHLGASVGGELGCSGLGGGRGQLVGLVRGLRRAPSARCLLRRAQGRHILGHTPAAGCRLNGATERLRLEGAEAAVAHALHGHDKGARSIGVRRHQQHALADANGKQVAVLINRHRTRHQHVSFKGSRVELVHVLSHGVLVLLKHQIRRRDSLFLF
mmetsp:Transcript_38291/g.121950  ORF Transcript_38291/g.121950 Transcript_38291/m.121950 type:complete len:211 (+) Transcript_38291:293-925(+)